MMHRPELHSDTGSVTPEDAHSHGCRRDGQIVFPLNSCPLPSISKQLAHSYTLGFPNEKQACLLHLQIKAVATIKSKTFTITSGRLRFCLNPPMPVLHGSKATPSFPRGPWVTPACSPQPCSWLRKSPAADCRHQMHQGAPCSHCQNVSHHIFPSLTASKHLFVQQNTIISFSVSAVPTGTHFILLRLGFCSAFWTSSITEHTTNSPGAVHPNSCCPTQLCHQAGQLKAEQKVANPWCQMQELIAALPRDSNFMQESPFRKITGLIEVKQCGKNCYFPFISENNNHAFP